MNDVLSYLNNKGISYKIQGNDAVIVCPECKLERLWINIESGLYHCWHCEAKNQYSKYVKGHISKLMKEWGDIVEIRPITIEKEKEEKDYTIDVERYHYDLLQNRQAIKEIMSEGFNVEYIEKFKWGFTRRKGQNWWVIPSYEGGIPKLLKLRKLEPDENKEIGKYIRDEGGKSVLWNGDIIEQYDEIVIAEGEKDAATLVKEGYENTVGITAGATSLLTAWFDRLRLKKKIYLVLDNDEAGQGAAENIWARRLGINKCWNVLLPRGKDVTDYFKDHTKEEFDKLIENATRFKVGGILTLQEALYQLYQKTKSERTECFELPWPKLNELLDGGLVRQRMTVIGGIPGSGKTSLGLQILLHFIKKYDIGALFFCLEMPETALASKIVQIDYNISGNEVNATDALTYSLEMEYPLYFGYSPKLTINTYYNTIKEVRDRYGVEVFVLDNLQKMVRTGEEADIAKVSGELKDMAMELNIVHIIISQPRKLNADREPTIDDLKGSGAIPADADDVILLYRRRNKKQEALKKYSLEPLTLISVEKSRYSSGGQIQLLFIGEKSKFVEVAQHKHSIL